MKARLLTFLRVIISTAFIIWLVWSMRDKRAQTVNILKNIDMSLFVTGGIFFMLGAVIVAHRLKYLFRAQGLTMSSSEAISLTLVGYFFNNFLPTSFGGDIVKAYYASKKTKDKINSFATILIDRSLGFFSLAIFASVGLCYGKPYIINTLNTSIKWSMSILLVTLGIIFILLWNGKLTLRFLSPVFKKTRWFEAEEKIKRAYNTIDSFKNKRATIMKAFIISVICQIVAFYSIYFWAKGLNSPISIATVLFTMPFISIAPIIIPSINGLGVRESAMVFFLGPNMGYENAFALSLLWLFMLMIISILGGINYALNKQYRNDVAITKGV